MPPLQSAVDPRAESFRRHREENLRLLAEVRALEAAVRSQGESARERFERRGQLLPRERVGRLLDPGAPLLEFSTLAGLGLHDDDGRDSVTGGAAIVVIGHVAGVRCLVLADDSAIKGGAISPMGLRKRLRAHEIARRNRLPLINLVESAGANLNYQAEIFVEGGRTFANLARLSAAGIPVLSVVHGSSTAGGAYLPGLSDYVIAVRGRAKIFLAGPPLVKAALGQDADDESLGGAELHASVTGTSEYLAEDDAHALALAREVVAKLWPGGGADFGGGRDGAAALAATPARPPRFDPDEILGIVPPDYRVPYDAREVIARLVDDSDFLEWKALYGPHTVCGHAAVDGHPCGLIANNGPLDVDGSTKAGQFIQLCCQSGTPLVYLQNTTGYMVGKEAEQRGIVKHGSKMIQAVANATVPQLTLHIGASFGAGNYGMCGRAYDPRFLFAWPNARIAVMGGEQAAGVMTLITEAKWRRDGREIDAGALERMHSDIVERLERESTALYATARLWDDGIIDPRDSRRVLAFALATCREAERRELRPSTFGVARF
ncbi:MAG TPA: carboxyl transferase domain-containing protein [Thermoanaerobaculia bacterium]|nr:carboxyl transferase domain-containing protein [Thermoanaerobaculia bacterium]